MRNSYTRCAGRGCGTETRPSEQLLPLRTQPGRFPRLSFVALPPRVSPSCQEPGAGGRTGLSWTPTLCCPCRGAHRSPGTSQGL